MNEPLNTYNAPTSEEEVTVTISLLVAADTHNVIGKNNQLPWHLPVDLKYFKNLTWGLPILMGRKTFESIGKALPGRKNIVITRNKSWSHEGTDVVHTLEEATEKAKSLYVKELFVIGGANIFTTAFAKAGRLYLTRIHHSFDGDVFLPSFPEAEWQLISERIGTVDEKNIYPHTFQVWEKRKK